MDPTAGLVRCCLWKGKEEEASMGALLQRVERDKWMGSLKKRVICLLYCKTKNRRDDFLIVEALLVSSSQTPTSVSAIGLFSHLRELENLPFYRLLAATAFSTSGDKSVVGSWLGHLASGPRPTLFLQPGEKKEKKTQCLLLQWDYSLQSNDFFSKIWSSPSSESVRIPTTPQVNP